MTDKFYASQFYQKKYAWNYNILMILDERRLLKQERAVGFGAIHDASFMGQPRDGSQQAYALMLAPTQLYEGKALTHLIDWGSGKIHRKMRSTLACEASSAARAFDRGCVGRVVLYEIEYGLKHKWNSGRT